MKTIKLLTAVALLFCATNTIQAQVMAARAEWVTIKSANLKCWECKERFERYLIKENKANFESGIIQWKFNLVVGEVRYQYIPDRVTADDIRIIMNNAGFDADTTKAEPTVYAKLPPICKRVEDGGGPQPKKPCHIPPYNN